MTERLDVDPQAVTGPPGGLVPRRVAVIGCGYVGTVVAACLAHIGHQAIGVEVDLERLALLRSGVAPFAEADLDELLVAGLSEGALRFSREIGEAMQESDVVFLCVGTPPGDDGQPNLTAMEAVAREVAVHLRSRHVLVNKSTVPVGSGRWLASMIEDVTEDPLAVPDRLAVVSNPEFLREGSAVADYLHPERLVLGGDDPAAIEELAALYRPILDQDFPGCPPERPQVPLIRTDLITAEMAKYASNAFLATKVSFANEIARLCELVGADVTEVTTVMGLDSRIGDQFLDAGLGWGGSCLGKDLAALISTGSDYGYPSRILQAVNDVNFDQRRLVLDHLQRLLKTLRGVRVAMLGLSFKPHTDDLRESPALDVARRLVAQGAFVTAYDPVIPRVPAFPELRTAPNPYLAARGADAVVIATAWPEFADLDLPRLRSMMRGDTLLDGRNQLAPAAVERAGLTYQGIGRPSQHAPSPVPVPVSRD